MFIISLSLHKLLRGVAGGQSWHLEGPERAQNDPRGPLHLSYVVKEYPFLGKIVHN